RYRWDRQLINKLPMESEVPFGGGLARVDIGGLQLGRVDLHRGVGEVDMDLRGRPRHSYDVSINGGIGKATVRVSADAAVYAEAHGGIGSITVHGLRKMGDHWESDSYASAQNRIKIEAHGGIRQ